jgi:hypothetical protein
MSDIETFAQSVIQKLDNEWEIDPIHAEKSEGMETSITRQTDQFSVIIGVTDELLNNNEVYVLIPKEVYGVPDRPNQIDHTLDRDAETVAADITQHDPA